jgi:hypothetical protein
VPFGKSLRCPAMGREHLLGRVASHGRAGRVEPDLEPSIAPRTVYHPVRSDTTAAAGPPGMLSEIDSEPPLFDSVRREAQLTSALSRSSPAERSHVGNVLYLLLVGLIGVAIIGVFFGIAFSMLTQPKDKTVIDAGPVSSSAEEAGSTAKGTTSPGDPPATRIASAETAPALDPTHVPEPPAPPPHVSSSPAAATLAGPPGEPTANAGDRRSRAHSATRRGGSNHHHSRPAAQAEKHRTLSAATDRAHHENFSDSFQSLTPPRVGARNPFDQLITQLTGQTKPVQSLTPP